MKIINLLPKEEIKQLRLETVSSQILGFWIWVLVSLAVVFTLSIASTILLTQKISYNNDMIEQKKEELRTSTTKQLEQEVSSLNERILLIDRLRKDHYYWSNAYIELVNMLDTDVTLDTVTMNRETGMVEVQGLAADREGVLSFWAAVKKSTIFEKINFPLTNLEKDVDANFGYIFYLKPEEMKKE
jgi:hypothetical protein